MPAVLAVLVSCNAGASSICVPFSSGSCSCCEAEGPL